MSEAKSPNLNQNLSEPTLMDLLNLLERRIMLNFNCHHIATIKSFDPVNQTATATINYTKTKYTRVPNNDKGTFQPVQIPYPPLTDCPVFVLGGGKGSLQFPIISGDECMALFNDRDMDRWYSGQNGVSNRTGRLHAFSDATLLVGLRSMNTKLSGYDSTKVGLINDKAKILLGLTKISIKNDSKNLYTILNTLATKLNTLATDITALTVTCATPGNPSSPPLNSAAFIALASDFTTLASDLGALLE